MLIARSDRHKMVCFLYINATEVIGLFNLSLEVIKVRELFCILEGLVIKRPIVPTGAEGSIRLILQMQGGAIELGVLGINFLNYS